MNIQAAVERDETPSAFEQACRVRIAHLSPEAEYAGHDHIEANIALIWPYSSSTSRLSILLAERDIRLRESKGQVKVTFRGDCAREVAQTHVGIGDYIKLALQDATWTRTGEEVATPGKKVDWDIDLSRRVKLEFKRGRDTSLLDFVAQSSPSEPKHGFVPPTKGPSVNGVIDIRKARLSGSYLPSAQHTPHRVTSRSFIDASLDPFADDDGYIIGKGRKRTKFARNSGTWRLLRDDEEYLSSAQRDNQPSSAPQTPTRASPSRHETEDVVSVEEQGKAATSAVDVPVPVTEPQAEPEPEPEPEPAPRAQEVDIVPLEDGRDIVSQEDADAVVSPLPPTAFTKPELPPILMGPPQTPSSTFQRRQLHLSGPLNEPMIAIPTPILRPLPSPGLALVSPLVERPGLTTGYFSMMVDPQSELDAISQGRTASYEQTAPMPNLVLRDVPITTSGQPTIPQGPAAGHTEPSDSVDLIFGDMQTPMALTNLADNTNSEIVQTSEMCNDAVQLMSEVSNEEPDVSQEVDLEALQQHIEDSTHDLKDTMLKDQVEDQDMYGPPIGAGFPALVRTSDLATPIGMEDLTQPVLVGAVHNDQDSTSSQLEDLVDASAYSAGAAGKSFLQEAFEEAESIEDGQSDSDSEHSLDEEAEIKPTATLDDAIPHRAPELASERSIFSSSPLPQPGNNIAGLDGVSDLYENEDERTRQRADSIGARSTFQTQTVEVFSSSPKPSPLLQQDQDILSSHGNQDESVREAEQGPARNRVDAVEEAEESTASRLEPYDETSATSSAREVMAADDRVQPPLNRDQFSFLPTPDATQVEPGRVEAATLYIDVPSVFPPTPALTQDLDDNLHPMSSILAQKPSAESGERAEPPESVTTFEESKNNRRVSQRLSRRSFTSDQVTNEYFTPRRSARNVQPIQSPVRPTSSAAGQPQSPRISKTRSRKPLTIAIADPARIQHDEDDNAVSSATSLYGTMTPLSYFPRLSTLHEHFNQQVDVIAVCSTSASPPQESAKGPKDFYATLVLADASFADDTTVTAQVFRPREAGLPSAGRGDVVLLRNMKVQLYEHKAALLSTNTSAWAVFKHSSGRASDVVVSGPPVEYGKPESSEVDRMFNWWTSKGQEQYSDPPRMESSGRSQETGPGSHRVTRSQRRKANTADGSESVHEQYQGHGSQDKPVQSRENLGSISTAVLSPTQLSAGDIASPTTPVRRSNHRRGNSRRSESIVHELRDGTKYVDDENSVIHELRDGVTYIDE